MRDAYDESQPDDFGRSWEDYDGYAAEIEALRDWLPDMPPLELLAQWCDEAACYDLLMVRATMKWVRFRLTEQARVAREAGPH